MLLRTSPSGSINTPIILTGIYNDEPTDDASAATGGGGYETMTFLPVVDPATALSSFGNSSVLILSETAKLLKYSVERREGNSNVTVPTGDANITYQLQTFNTVTNVQTDVPGSLLSFAPAEFGIKTVELNLVLDVGLFMFPRISFPTTWVQGNQAVQVYHAMTNTAV